MINTTNLKSLLKLIIQTRVTGNQSNLRTSELIAKVNKFKAVSRCNA